MAGTQSALEAPLRDLSGKVAFVTGGSSGIGLGIARACKAAGMKVAITYLTEAHNKKAQRYFCESRKDFHSIRIDVRDAAAVRRAAMETHDRFGGVHLVCANAGVGISTPICQASEQDWDEAIRTNILGVVNTINAFLPIALADGTDRVHFVATSSMSGLFHGASAGVYTTTKYAVVGLMEALRGELHRRGIGVSVFCPGLVRSRILDQHRNRQDSVSGRSKSNAFEDRRARAMAVGMDALECGKKLLRGIRRNDMYILTHPEYVNGLNDRFRALMGAFDLCNDMIPNERVEAERAVLRHPVYLEEIERQRLRNR